jgi:2-C-methyl-D-erythritol 4-phosphate cytidylyltransferase
MDSVWAIVVAAGSGDRFGGPKQYEALGDRRVLDWSLTTAREVCDGIVLVVPPERSADEEPVDLVVPGGTTRSASVRAGLAAVPTDVEVIVVHDAARPLASIELWHRVVAAVVSGADAAVPGVAVADTLRRIGGGVVDRSDLVAAQTPQAFRADGLRQAHAGEPEATDDAGPVESLGGRVVLVDGEPNNLKITTASDLLVAAALAASGR